MHSLKSPNLQNGLILIYMGVGFLDRPILGKIKVILRSQMPYIKLKIYL